MMQILNLFPQITDKTQLYYLIGIITIYAVPTNVFGQADATFTTSASQGCDSLQVDFTMTGSPGGGIYNYYWYFEPGQESTDENPTHSFSSVGNYEVICAVTNTSTSDTDTTRQTIEVFTTPADASLIIRNESNLCPNGVVRFYGTASNHNSKKWLFGDGQSSDLFANYENHVYTTISTFEAAMVAYNGVCTDTAFQTVVIEGPHAEISITPDAACEGSELEFSFTDVIGSDITAHTWDFNDGTVVSGNPVTHTYSGITGQKYVELTITNSSNTCTIQDTINIYQVEANFILPDQNCHQDTIRIHESSVGANGFRWKLDGSQFSILQNPPPLVLNTGTYEVELKVEHQAGCVDSTSKTFTVHALPVITISNNATICPGEQAAIEVSGGDAVDWSPGISVEDSTALATYAMPDSNTVYHAYVTNTSTGCSNTDSLKVFVQSGFQTGYISVGINDSVLVENELIVGDSVSVWLYDSLSRTLSYTWTPDYRISCTDCPTPVLQPIENTSYTLAVTDTNECNASEEFIIPITVRQEYYIGMQAAFTPNNDGINDEIGVDDWGIKTLLEFQIFNRNGNLVFKSDATDNKWDGTYNNKPQPSGTYMYMIKAEMWNNTIKTSQGTFNLIR